MTNARLLNRPEDFKRLGINPEKVEVWEDRRRVSSPAPNNSEWWYFDSILDDGSTAVIQWFTKSGANIAKAGDHPAIAVKITAPDGTRFQNTFKFKSDDTSYGEDQCDLRFGANTCKGDLKTYHIHMEPADGLGSDLILESMTTPYRPSTGYITFGSDEEFYTWLCVVPKGKVSGTLTYGGETHQVTGFGYHDHQWFGVNFQKKFNHWVWARQSFDDYTMLTFDMVTNKESGYVRFPIVFIEDKDGNIVFENTQNVTCNVLDEYHDEASDKDYPKSIRYIFENDGKRVDYALDFRKIIEANGKNNIPFVARMAIKAMGINPAYTRYLSNGTMKLTNGDEVIERTGELIYEFMYPGETYKGHM